ncbi:MAG: hypothetical protein JW973_09690 [Bacteroidales bacterium]|nr:hypothetical protein [Bacteroidales bacterium]
MGYPNYSFGNSGNKYPGLAIILCIFLAGAISLSCHEKGKKDDNLPSWSSNDPLAIPYFIRQQKTDKGNLVRNPSFESGKWLKVDSLHKSFSLDGWQKTGNHVTWIDLTNDTTLSYDEVYTGQHAIRISRTTADEIADKGEGIMSGFIRVIPGNYSFTFYARMLDIRPYSARLGTRMYDAVEIKIIYFDKNKIKIDSRYLLPLKDKKIDNSFKSLSLANFNYIKEFDWGRIIGKSHSFPFSEGDIPDDARYIKLFIGLKGTGTIWIDDIDFHYTKSNFTPLERFTGIMDSALSKQDLIIPTPKQISRLESIVLFRRGQGIEDLPKIIVPVHPEKETDRAANILLEKIISALTKAGAGNDLIARMRLQHTISQSELNESTLIFSIGKSILYEKYMEMLPLKAITGHDQGYFAYTSNDLPRVIFLAGNNAVGDFYAVNTITQLFDNQSPILYNARIIDYPDVNQRFISINAWSDIKELTQQVNIIRDLLPFKLNGAYIHINLNTPLQPYLNSLEFFGSHWKSSNLFQYIQWVLPDITDSFPKKVSDPSIKYNKMPMDEDTRHLIRRIIETGNKSYASGLAIAPAYIMPSDSTLEYNLSEVLRLTDCFRAETEFILYLQHYLNGAYPDQSMEYCLPWFNNELVDYSLGYADVFVTSLIDDLDENVSFLWSGSSFYTIKTDAADIFRFNSLVKSPPVLIDNSFLTVSKETITEGSLPYYPRKIRLYNIFEPYCNAELYYYNDRINKNRVLVNQTVHTELEKIKILTALDFYWNMEVYDMDFSLWKILVSRYGIDVAKELIVYGDALTKMIEVNLRMQQNDQVNKNYRIGTSALLDLSEHLNHIAAGLGNNHPLAVELTEIYSENKSIFETYGAYIP